MNHMAKITAHTEIAQSDISAIQYHIDSLFPCRTYIDLFRFYDFADTYGVMDEYQAVLDEYHVSVAADYAKIISDLAEDIRPGIVEGDIERMAALPMTAMRILSDRIDEDRLLDICEAAAAERGYSIDQWL